MRAHMGVAGIRTSSQPFFDFLRLYSCLGMRPHRCRTLDHISEGKQSLLRGHKQPQSVFGDILWLKTLKLILHFESSLTLFQGCRS